MPVCITSDDMNPMPKHKSNNFGDDIEFVKLNKSSDSLEVIYKQLTNGDYIIQPKFMLNSGSMCITELYSKALRVKLVHELLFKAQMQGTNESRLPKITQKVLPSTMTSTPSKASGIIRKFNGLVKLRRPSEEISDKVMIQRINEVQKKKQWKNRSLVKFEKIYSCGHNNTDSAGTLLRNMSPIKRSLKNTSYLRAKECLKALDDKEDKKIRINKNKLLERFKKIVKISNNINNLNLQHKQAEK